MGPTQPKCRADLVVSRRGTPEEATVVKDPVTGRFYLFKEVEGFILRNLDGATPLARLRSRVEREFGGGLPPHGLEQFIEKLRARGLLEEEGDARANTPPGERRIRGNPFYIRLKAFDPDRLFDRLVGRVRFFFSPLFLAGSFLLILVASGVTIANQEEIGRDLLRLHDFQAVLLAWLTIISVTIAHELAHGITCKRFGGHVHEVGVMLIYFQPALYCNVSDAWLIPEKSKRLWVTFAGAYLDLLVWAIAALAWRVTDPGIVVNYLALVVMATSGIKILINLNPLIKLDGYYLLSDYLEVPNLRQKAFGYLKARMGIASGQAGGSLEEVSPRERRVYLSYGLLAGFYTVCLLGYLALWLGGLLVDRYQGWGLVLFISLLVGIFHRPIGRQLDKVTGMRDRWKGGAGSFTRMGKVVAGLSVIAAALFFGRMELKVSGEFRILPEHNADVRTEVEGIIERIFVKEGDNVEKGALIAQLADLDSQSRLREINAEIDENQAELRMLEAGPRPEELGLARTAVEKGRERLKYAKHNIARVQSLFSQRLSSRKDLDQAEEELAVREKELQEAQGRLGLMLAGSRSEEIEARRAELARVIAQRSHLEEQLERLKVTSPISGIVTTPKLEEKIGQLVKKGDLVTEVHSLKTVTAEIVVPEKEISEVNVGQTVVLKARAYPSRSFRGKVTSIATTATKETEGAWGEMVLVPTQLDNSALLLKPQMTGNAKIYCGKRRIIDLLTRRLTRYLRVEFWSWW
jgi:multidrug resistance efflux pump